MNKYIIPYCCQDLINIADTHWLIEILRRINVWLGHFNATSYYDEHMTGPEKFKKRGNIILQHPIKFMK